MSTLGAKLRALAALVEAGELPDSAALALERVLEAPSLRVAVRDGWVRTALVHVRYSVPALHHLLVGDGWRWRLWLARGIPEDATPAELACCMAHLFGPVPDSLRALYFIVNRTARAFHSYTNRLHSPETE